MISALVPDSVKVVETDTPWALETDPLFPSEALLLGVGAVERRRREFAVGRTCARRALKLLGLGPEAILKGAHREPLWPARVVGSITHCDGYAAAAVALAKHVVSIGIDAEVNAALPAGVAATVCTPPEQRWVESAPEMGVHWSTLVFSAKESVYKAWFPIARKWLGYDDVEIAVEPQLGTFRARVLVPESSRAGSPGMFCGRFAVANRHVLTAVVVTPGAPQIAHASMQSGRSTTSRHRSSG